MLSFKVTANYVNLDLLPLDSHNVSLLNYYLRISIYKMSQRHEDFFFFSKSLTFLTKTVF